MKKKVKPEFVVERVSSDIPGFFDITVSCGKVVHKMCRVPFNLVDKMTKNLQTQVKNDIIKQSIKFSA